MQLLHKEIASPWALANHVHATSVDGSLVLLDIKADRYMCLPRSGADLAIADDLSTLNIGNPTLAAKLQAAGLIRSAEVAVVPPARRAAAPPTESAVESDYPAPRWRDTPEAAASVFDVAVGYRARSLADIIARCPNVLTDPPREPLRTTLDRFQRWVPFAPVSAKCLLRSFMLRRLLHRQGHVHDWVFGVTLWPFKAHCWLQADGVVLNDTVEAVSAYRSIMVV
jgi:hypothetical protein